MSDDGIDVPPMIRQGQLIQEISAGLAQGVNRPWQRLVYSARLVAPFMQDTLMAVDAEGFRDPVRIPRTRRLEAMQELREVMYRPGAGTWYTMVLTISQPGDVGVDFDCTGEPEWVAPVSPHYYATDQSHFPRDEASQPEWLKAQLALAAADS